MNAWHWPSNRLRDPSSLCNRVSFLRHTKFGLSFVTVSSICMNHHHHHQHSAVEITKQMKCLVQARYRYREFNLWSNVITTTRFASLSRFTITPKVGMYRHTGSKPVCLRSCACNAVPAAVKDVFDARRVLSHSLRNHLLTSFGRSSKHKNEEICKAQLGGSRVRMDFGRSTLDLAFIPARGGRTCSLHLLAFIPSKVSTPASA